MYTTPLSTLISSCSLNHHLYADDTQLFLSFLPTHLHSSIDHLHDAVDRISSWMTANLLTLNSSKTEFLLIGLSKQLAKINNSSLTTTHAARNLGFMFDEHLTFSDQISSVSKSCYYHIRQLCCIRPYLDTKTASIFDNSTCERVLDLLEPGDLRLGQVVIKRVAIVKLGVNNGSSDGGSYFGIEVWEDTAIWRQMRSGQRRWGVHRIWCPGFEHSEWC